MPKVGPSIQEDEARRAKTRQDVAVLTSKLESEQTTKTNGTNRVTIGIGPKKKEYLQRDLENKRHSLER